MDSKTMEARNVLQNALAALQRGDRESARRLALEASTLAPELEQSWLILSALSSPAESLGYIEKALLINPDSPTAQHALDWANQKLQKKRTETVVLGGKPDLPAEETRLPQEEPKALPADLPQTPAEESLKLPEKMHAPIRAANLTDSRSRGKRARFSPALIILFSVLGLLILAALAGWIFLRPQVTRYVTNLLHPVPTPQCIEASLTLGSTRYRIESVTRKADAFPEIPANDPNIAYWLEGTNIKYVFALSPTTGNLGLTNLLKTGDPALITWADCSQDEYRIKSSEIAQASDKTIFDQSSGGLLVYLRTDVTTPMLVFRAERPVIQPLGTDQTPSVNSAQLDIQINYDLAAPDAGSVKIGLSITNQGTESITLTNTDLSLTVESQEPEFPLIVEPGLPMEILPGKTITLAATFPKPQANIAVLKILDITFDYYIQ